jgi:hypothetical protein
MAALKTVYPFFFLLLSQQGGLVLLCCFQHCEPLVLKQRLLGRIYQYHKVANLQRRRSKPWRQSREGCLLRSAPWGS